MGQRCPWKRHTRPVSVLSQYSCVHLFSDKLADTSDIVRKEVAGVQGRIRRNVRDDSDKVLLVGSRAAGYGTAHDLYLGIMRIIKAF